MVAGLVLVLVGSMSALAQGPGGDAPQGARGGAAQGGRGGGRQLSKPIEAPDLGVTPVPNPLPLPRGMAFGSLAGVVVNSKQHIFVYTGTRPELTLYKADPLPLVEFDPDGKFIRAWGAELKSDSPHGFRLDKDDNFYLSDIGDHTVTKLNPKGEVLFRLGTKGKAGVWDEATGNRTFNQPTDLAIAPNGDIFVAQGHGGPDPRVLRFDKTGKYITSWSGKTTGPAAFTNVHAITLDPRGRVWVGDRGAKKILIFDVDGRYLESIQMDVYVCSFYVATDGQLYMLSGWDGQVIKMDWNAKPLAVTGKPGRGLNQYGEAESLAINAKGEMFVADKINDYVQKLIPQVGSR
jgi:sugar lactone lactonase YvrE